MKKHPGNRLATLKAPPLETKEIGEKTRSAAQTSLIGFKNVAKRAVSKKDLQRRDLANDKNGKSQTR